MSKQYPKQEWELRLFYFPPVTYNTIMEKPDCQLCTIVYRRDHWEVKAASRMCAIHGHLRM